jgi:glycosyltransferase involved in cell wall biosynthesis
MQYSVENIDIVHHVEDIASLYRGHNCAVFASKAEGIGLPITEAMACGLPTITTACSGITEYANDSNAILLKDLKEEPIFDRNYFPNRGEFGTWQIPSLDELAHKMDWVLRNYRDALDIGTAAAIDMRTNYSWELAAKKFFTEVA